MRYYQTGNIIANCDQPQTCVRNLVNFAVHSSILFLFGSLHWSVLISALCSPMYHAISLLELLELGTTLPTG